MSVGGGCVGIGSKVSVGGMDVNFEVGVEAGFWVGPACTLVLAGGGVEPLGDGGRLASGPGEDWGRGVFELSAQAVSPPLAASPLIIWRIAFFFKGRPCCNH